MAATQKQAGIKERGARPGPAWFGRKELANILDVTEVQAAQHYIPMLPPDAVHRDGRRVWVHVRKLINLLVTKAEEAATRQPGDDPLLAGDDSPALERYRMARASLAELELERQRKTHVSLNDLTGLLTEFGGIIRRGGEILQRRWGNDASDVLNECVDEAIERLRRTRPGTGDGGDGGKDSPPAQSG